ncbi:hypothetical protein [Rhizobium leguminosarum]|uniref:hypothetical protein n=1 Tax=Rhizobium leguminosarum TaxID=384 RepID=UPI0013AF4A3A|nr:hypothetical protein [Rhizobium leguminosarum]
MAQLRVVAPVVGSIFTAKFEKTILHGHMPTETDLPEIHSNRIAVETSAFEYGQADGSHQTSSAAFYLRN